MPTDQKMDRVWLLIGTVVLIAVFSADVSLPLGVVAGPLYVLVAVLALRMSARWAIMFGAIATAANVLAYSVAPTVGIPEWMVGASRVLTVCTSWLLIVIGLHLHRQSLLVVAKLQEDHARQQLASEAAELGFWTNDLTTGDIVFDLHWLATLGYQPDEVEYTAAWYSELIHPEDQRNVELAWRKHLSGQSDVFEVEHRLMSRGRVWKQVLSRGQVIARDAAGTPLRAAGTHLDVTATRELERTAAQALRDRNRELQLVTDAIPMMIAYLDAAQRFRFVNKAAAAACGCSVDDLKGRHLSNLLGADTYRKFVPFVASTLRGERAQFEEAVELQQTSCWWVVHLLPRVDDDGRVLGFYMLITDVTGIRRFEEEIERQREALALHHRRGVANEMVAAIAHELNQPLATISIYAGELRDSLQAGRNEAVELERALALVEQEAQRAGQIMRKIREQIGSHRLTAAKTNVRCVVESVRQICEFRLRTSRIMIETQIDENVEHVAVDQLQLQQVLANLINNAIDASADVEASTCRITVHVASNPNGVHFRVIDCGHGLPEAQLQQIFMPYYTTKPDGLGIGLNICHSIVAAHGGKLWATPNEQAGVTFHVLLPHASPVEAARRTRCGQHEAKLVGERISFT